jgi:tRNA pseudouridine38-40 synthase
VRDGDLLLEEVNSAPSAARRLRATVEYDGTGYQGFQIQLNGPTIQGALEKALYAVMQQQIRVIGSGRTDSGVHALGQVVHCALIWEHPLDALQRAWNSKLPIGIAVRDLRYVADDFHARFSARSREYRYALYTSQVRRPLLDRFYYHFSDFLDLDIINRAAALLIGKQDFSAFGRPPQGTNAVRTVYRASCRAEGDTILFDIEADAFLRRMVRLVVGTLLLAGRGVLSVEQFRDILQSRKLDHPMAAVPPCGLCLMRVNYDSDRC